MAGQRPGTVIIPWYATGFRANALEAPLNEVAAIALRYRASGYDVYRSREDRYRYQQLAHFEDYLDWQRYWEGPEMVEFRVAHSGWYQVPVLYAWWDRPVTGEVLVNGAAPANGPHAGNGAPVGEIV